MSNHELLKTHSLSRVQSKKQKNIRSPKQRFFGSAGVPTKKIPDIRNRIFRIYKVGTSVSAFWYSLIQAATPNGNDRWEFLIQLLNGLPAAKTLEDTPKLFNDAIG
jgi:hypothetical protein